MRRVTPNPLGTKGKQLSMFMTPNQIKAEYQPLDGDRMARVDAPGGDDIRGGWDNPAYTDRHKNTQGETNWSLNSDARVPGGKQYGYNPGNETDAHLWSRKAEEAHMGKQDYAYAQGGSSYARQQEPQLSTEEIFEHPNYPQQARGESTDDYGDRENSFIDSRADSHQRKVESYYEDDSSLADSIAKEGVKNPVHLGRQFGTQGKPQIVGGHHRLAVAPGDDLIPVLHHNDIYDARKNSSKGYDYT